VLSAVHIAWRDVPFGGVEACLCIRGVRALRDCIRLSSAEGHYNGRGVIGSSCAELHLHLGCSFFSVTGYTHT
jgi:hypothetical protein